MKVLFAVVTFFIATNTLAGLLYGEKKGVLQVSENLRRDVQFWEDIFSKYESNQCVYHDSKNLDVIFWISNMPTKSKRQARRQMKKQKSQIKVALRALSKGKKPKTWLQRRISGAVPNRLKSRRYYRKAMHRIRCQRGVATDFRKSLVRSKTFLPMIKKRLQKSALPADLAYLPHLESGFNVKAHSKVGARGLWQLMPGTARQFIKVNRRRDDRVNPYLSTTVAARILKDNYRKTKDWPLAITAYNYGINGVVRAIKKYGTNDYEIIRRRHRTRIFGFAAKNFYPSFIAVRNLAMNYENKNGMRELEPIARGKRRTGTVQ